MSSVVLVGPDEHDLAAALEAEGFAVTVTNIGNRPALEEAGIHDAAVFVLTDLEQATSISVAHDLNPEAELVVYADGSLPEFATRQTDLMVDPALLDPSVVAEELAAEL